jgi:hypothetical protein
MVSYDMTRHPTTTKQLGHQRDPLCYALCSWRLQPTLLGVGLPASAMRPLQTFAAGAHFTSNAPCLAGCNGQLPKCTTFALQSRHAHVQMRHTCDTAGRLRTLFLIWPSQPGGSFAPMWCHPKCTTLMILARAGSSSAGQSHAPLSPVSHRKWSRPCDLVQGQQGHITLPVELLHGVVSGLACICACTRLQVLMCVRSTRFVSL